MVKFRLCLIKSTPPSPTTNLLIFPWIHYISKDKLFCIFLDQKFLLNFSFEIQLWVLSAMILIWILISNDKMYHLYTSYLIYSLCINFIMYRFVWIIYNLPRFPFFTNPRFDLYNALNIHHVHIYPDILPRILLLQSLPVNWIPLTWLIVWYSTLVFYSSAYRKSNNHYKTAKLSVFFWFWIIFRVESLLMFYYIF